MTWSGIEDSLVGFTATLADVVRRGLVAIWLGIDHLLAWLAWAENGIERIAIPEIVGSVVGLARIMQTSRRVRRSSAWSFGYPNPMKQ